MTHEHDARIPLIYVLGNSHSGSTVLGFYIACDERVFYAGELKKYYDLPGRVCSCSEPLENCCMWSEFAGVSHGNFGTNVPMRRKIRSVLSLFSGTRFPHTKEEKETEFDIIKRVFETARNRKNQTAVLVDSSKSLWRLMFLESLDFIDLKVIHLERDLKGNMASFIKRGHGFLGSLVKILVNDFLIRIYKKKTNTPVIDAFYQDLASNPTTLMADIAEFIDLPDAIPSDLNPNAHELHVPTGNDFTREQFHRSTHVLKRKDEWNQLMRGWQLKLLESLSGTSDA